MSDIELFEIARQCKIDVNKDLHLLAVVEEALAELLRDATEPWEFRMLRENRTYWVNRETNATSRVFPMLEELRLKMDVITSKIKRDTADEKKKDFEVLASEANVHFNGKKG